MLQINTLYSHTIGCCVTSFYYKVDKDNETECLDTVLTDKYRRNKPLVQYNTHPYHHFSKILALITIPTKNPLI